MTSGFVDELAFWGHAVASGVVPRAYAAGVLSDHPAYHRFELPPWERLAAALEDLEDWEDIVVSMLYAPEEADRYDFSKSAQQLMRELRDQAIGGFLICRAFLDEPPADGASGAL